MIIIEKTKQKWQQSPPQKIKQTTTSLEAELAAMREELAALGKLFEERYQAQ